MPKALISVYDKTGLLEFAKELTVLGWELVASGGTFKFLTDNGLKVTKVEDVTGFPEIMDGRVKTLHPKIHGGILADRSDPRHLEQAKANGIELIDMVVVNLYPFKQIIERPGATEQDAIHNIDIGGPAMLRAAAKNFSHVLGIIDPNDYGLVIAKLKTGEVDLETRKSLAVKIFAVISGYDQQIASYFSAHKNLVLTFEKVTDLRYGENPHQQAALYKEQEIPETAVINSQVLHGKELSFNNIVDADAALNLIKEFEQPAAAVIKHTNPCGCAVSKDIDGAFLAAYEADSKSAFGGIIVLNRAATKKIAEYVNKVFAEIVIAPDFEPGSLKILEQKKNIRLIKTGPIVKASVGKDYRKIIGGMLEQDLDRKLISEKDFSFVTKKKPSQNEMKDLIFAFKLCRHVKSNAIVLVKNGVTVGVGAGQTSRVDSLEIALKKAGVKVKGGVAASDAFFPFRDSVDLLADAGVAAIIQPGGSIQDKEVIKAATERGLAMVFTGTRVFRH
ncbi:MAG: bifunctional phosphoribosylaminoimidazolecarboxamide formyltransferase/IMP cyclohydrolase [Candidatus Doudnabacteria bacterium]|nr:bifunctional phosphoribosylaminoimidazolecarboxamide formyltransferase/IMP cyclohydrolase [Candidatus Doudnabacteria bacterium]